MADDYKTGANWQALNRIWKALPAAAREAVKNDFRLLTDVIREKNEPLPEAQPEAPARVEHDFENRYLEGMSKATKAYALKCLTQGHINVYQEISDFIVENKIRDMDGLWDQYAKMNEVTADSAGALREMMCFCLERARIQKLV
jgi:hypothetical protein